MKTSPNPSATLQSAPTPSELVAVAVALGFKGYGPNGSRPREDDIRDALAQALCVWRLAAQTIRDSAETMSEADVRHIAEEADALRSWSDSKIALDIFGRNDPDSQQPGARKPVTDDAIRVALSDTLHHIGTAAFYLGKERGVSTAAAETLRQLIAQIREARKAGETVRADGHLLDRVAAAFSPQSGNLEEIRAYLTARAKLLSRGTKRAGRKPKLSPAKTK